MQATVVAKIGALLFGAVVGWITYRSLRRRTGGARLADIATVIAAVAGGAAATLFKDPDLFGFYAIGLAAGFFGYLAVSVKVLGLKAVVGMPPQASGNAAGTPAAEQGAAPAQRPTPQADSGFMGEANRSTRPAPGNPRRE
jgi:hypothetical protein